MNTLDALAIHFVEPCVEAIVHLGVDVTGHEVVILETDSVLFLFNNVFSCTRAIGINYAQFCFKFTMEFLVPK